MSYKRITGIALSFVGLVVGAGFATGREVVQYFSSYGMWGLAGAAIAGIVMALAGTVFLQLGSYFHAREHRLVFKRTTHPIVSILLDISVVITLFSIGFVMLAGAGSNLEQQFGWQPWVGSTVMLGLVLVAGMLDVNKVSRIIGLLTPLIIIAILAVAVYTFVNWPDDVNLVAQRSAEIESPISNWLLSALNYNGLALILAVSMTLVIGGDYLDPREAGWGGLFGGIAYAIMLVLATMAMLFNAELIDGTSIPMLTLVADINENLGLVMALVIFAMVFNTAIGMFYALGKRLSAGRESQYRVIFIVGTLLGFAVSFVGFDTLMEYVYPVLGYMGMVMVVILVGAWVKSFARIRDEATKRARLRQLMYLSLHPDKELEKKHNEEMQQLVAESNLGDKELYNYVSDEVATQLDEDEDVEFSIGEDYKLLADENQLEAKDEKKADTYADSRAQDSVRPADESPSEKDEKQNKADNS